MCRGGMDACMWRTDCVMAACEQDWACGSWRAEERWGAVWLSVTGVVRRDSYVDKWKRVRGGVAWLRETGVEEIKERGVTGCRRFG